MLGDHDEHRPFEDYAVRHVMGGLDEAEQGTFRSHLLDCAECRARVGELRTIASELAEVERVERRERAAQKVKTEERAAEETPTLPTRRASRGARAAVVIGMLLIVLLSVWNFVLRAGVEDVRDLATALQESSVAINFGQPWTEVEVAPGHDGVARELDDRLAVMVRGTDDDATYRISMYDARGDLLGSEQTTSVEGVVRWYGGPLPDEIARVDVTLVRAGGETIVFRAASP
jgi:hypothetical protein